MSRTPNWLDSLFSGMVFKIAYLILAVLSFNAFVYYQPLMKYIIWLVTAFGAANCLYRIIYYKRFIKTPYLLVAALFLMSYVITIVVNYRYGFMESIQGLVWMVFQFALLYVCDMDKPYESIKSEFKRVGTVFVVCITLSCIVSILMVFFGFGEAYALNKYTIIPRGFVWGRLWGVFSDPNYGSASVSISSVICLFALRKATKRYQKIWLILSLVVSFLYIVFSDSRTGYVTVCCVLLVWFYFRFSDSKKAMEKKVYKEWKRRVIAIILAIAVSAGTFGAMFVTKKVYNCLITVQYTKEGEPGEDSEQTIERDYEDKVDISNRRFDLWKSGLELFQVSPVVGVGFRNFQAAAKENIPNTYLINNSIGDFDAFHDMWVDILVSQGFVGFAIFLFFAILCAIRITRKMHQLHINHSPDYLWCAMLFAALAASVISSLFLSDTTYVNTPNAVMFWLLLGYAMRYCAKDDVKLEKHGESI